MKRWPVSVYRDRGAAFHEPEQEDKEGREEGQGEAEEGQAEEARRRVASPSPSPSRTPIAIPRPQRLHIFSRPEGPTDNVELKLSWKGGEAALATLTDNGDLVKLGDSQRVGKNGLTLRWPSPDAFVHVLQWDLMFQGTRTELKATATVNGAGQFENPVGADSKKDRWIAAGTAEE